MAKREQGFGVIEGLLILVIIGLIGFIGWYVLHSKTAVSQTQTSIPKATIPTPDKKSSTPTKEAKDPYDGWKQFCSKQEKACFKYPSDWATKEITAADPTGDGIQLTSPKGSTVIWQSAVAGMGGVCEDNAPHTFISKAEPLTKYPNLYYVETGPKDSTNHAGLYESMSAPKIGDTGSCVLYTTFVSKHDAKVNSWLETSGVDTLKTDDLPVIKSILLSFYYQ